MLSVLVAMSFATATAGADVTFGVLNTDEEPPDGVWFRYGADPAQTDRVTGHGVYKNERIRVTCFARGTPFGPHHNDVWYYAFNETRPRVGDISNEGFLNAHYVDDGMKADQPHPSVGECGAPAQPAAPVKPVSLYFSPYRSGKFGLADTSVVTAHENEYVPVCSNPRRPYERAKALAGGQPLETLAGWSAGRLGVLGFLKYASPDELRALDYVLLIDPGVYGEMGCDRTLGGGDLLANWLVTNPDARLVVISGSAVTQKQRSKGIQETYFNAIRDRSQPPRVNLRPRVLTCNYDITHENAFRAARYWIAHRIGRSCPRLRHDGRAYPSTAGWNP